MSLVLRGKRNIIKFYEVDKEPGSLWHAFSLLEVRAKATRSIHYSGITGETSIFNNHLPHLPLSDFMFHQIAGLVTSAATDTETGARPFGRRRENKSGAEDRRKTYLSMMYLMLSCTLWSVRPLYGCMWKATCAKKHVDTDVNERD